MKSIAEILKKRRSAVDEFRDNIKNEFKNKKGLEKEMANEIEKAVLSAWKSGFDYAITFVTEEK